MTSSATEDQLNACFDQTASGDTPLAALALGANRYPERAALMDARRSLSFADLRAVIVELAGVLRGRGVRHGDRVMIAAENTPACVALLYATQQVGAWPAILNPRIGRGEVDALRASCQPRLMVFAVDDAPAAAELSVGAGITEYMSAWVGRLVFGVTTDSVPEIESGPAGARTALLIFTSGTLGLPKSVMLSASALANLGRVLAESRMTRAGDIVQGVAPLSHIMGISNLMSAMQAGAALKVMPRLELEVIATGIAAGTITHLSFVPTVYIKLMEYLDTHQRSLSASRLKYISCGGAPLDGSLKRRVEQKFGLRLVNGYGMTECAPRLRTRADRDAEADCIGWPEGGVETRIEGATDKTGIGELWLRSATMMSGYYADVAQTAAALRPDGWLATGDLVRANPDGSISIVGRMKEMIIRSGFNVYPAEVEAALNQLAQVVQSAVVGRRRPDGNEDIVAFVQLRDGAELKHQEMADALRNRIAPYKLPTRLECLPALPLGRTGKIWKAQLLQMAAALPL